MPRNLRLSLFIVPFVSLGALAAPADETIVVTANRKPTPLAQVGASVTVVDVDAAKSRGDVFVIDALRGLPGVSLTQTGGPGGQSVVRLRGEEGYRTLVLVDGIRVSDPAAPQSLTEFAHLLLSDVERIEIVRGPQSLLYGADAIGGVIAISTKRGQGAMTANAAASAGSFATFAGAASVSGSSGAFDYALSVHGFETDGYSAREGAGYSEDDGYSNTTFHAVLGYALGEDTRLEAVLRSYDAEAQFDRDNDFDGNADEDNQLFTEQTTARLALTTPLFDFIESTFAATYLTQNRGDYAVGAPFAFGARFDAERWRGEYSGRVALSEAMSFSFGGNYEDEEIVTDRPYAQHNWGVYAEWEGSPLSDLFLTAGARFDDHSLAGDHVSLRATAAWIVPLLDGDAPATLRASAGTGFRAPSLYELFDVWSGDPSLREERGLGFDVGVDQTYWGGRGSFSLTYFDQRIDDEIRFDPIGFTYIQNPGNSTSRGIEVQAMLQPLERLTLEASYTYDDATVNSSDAEDGLPRQRRPLHSWSVSALYPLVDCVLTLRLDARGAADAEDGFYTSRVRLDDYAVVDAALIWAVAPGWEATVRGSNLFSEQYQEVAGYATPDAAVSFSIRGIF